MTYVVKGHPGSGVRGQGSEIFQGAGGRGHRGLLLTPEDFGSCSFHLNKGFQDSDLYPRQSKLHFLIFGFYCHPFFNKEF